MGLLEAELVWNFGQMIADMGRSVVIRNLTTKQGPNPLPNPPSYVGLVLNGPANPGAGTISLRGTQLNGRLLTGDTITIAGHTYTVGGEVDSVNNVLTGIAITPTFATTSADGTAATLAFLADTTVKALVTAFPMGLVNGTTIQMTDRQVRFKSADLTFVPTTTDKVFSEGDVYSIINVKSMQLQGVVYGYACHVRR